MFRRAFFVVVALVLFGVFPHHAFAQSTADDATRRGDIAVGYAIGYADGRAMPVGLVMSQAWRVHHNLDLFGDAGFQHGSIPLQIDSTGNVRVAAGFNVIGLMGGVRKSWHTDFARAKDFVEVKFGLINESRSGIAPDSVIGASFVSGYRIAFAIEPGMGTEIGLSQHVAIRPQVGVRFVPQFHNLGNQNLERRADLHVAISAVFQSEKKK